MRNANFQFTHSYLRWSSIKWEITPNQTNQVRKPINLFKKFRNTFKSSSVTICIDKLWRLQKNSIVNNTNARLHSVKMKYLHCTSVHIDAINDKHAGTSNHNIKSMWHFFIAFSFVGDSDLRVFIPIPERSETKESWCDFDIVEQFIRKTFLHFSLIRHMHSYIFTNRCNYSCVFLGWFLWLFSPFSLWFTRVLFIILIVLHFHFLKIIIHVYLIGNFVKKQNWKFCVQ